MAIKILTSKFSFIQFAASDIIQACGTADIGLCLPVFDKHDIAFQFILQADLISEADALCDRTNSTVTLGIRLNCADANFATFPQKPERFRISPNQVLYNWQSGMDGFEQVTVGHCFYISVQTGAQVFCSNCLQKIGDDCHTSVLEYTNEDNAFDFNYCNSATSPDDAGIDCSPTLIQFTNVPSLVIPYTASMVAKYGILPSVKTWVYAPDGSLQEMGITEKFDTYPPSKILFDFGGNASGVVRIS